MAQQQQQWVGMQACSMTSGRLVCVTSVRRCACLEGWCGLTLLLLLHAVTVLLLHVKEQVVIWLMMWQGLRLQAGVGNRSRAKQQLPRRLKQQQQAKREETAAAGTRARVCA
jgi:hypothetical protein